MKHKNIPDMRRSLLITRRAVAERYDVCPRTVKRWEKRPGLFFPTAVVINGRAYYEMLLLETWDRECARAAALIVSQTKPKAEAK